MFQSTPVLKHADEDKTRCDDSILHSIGKCF